MNPNRAMNCPREIKTFRTVMCFFMMSSLRRFQDHREGKDKCLMESGACGCYPSWLPGSPPFHDARDDEFE